MYSISIILILKFIYKYAKIILNYSNKVQILKYFSTLGSQDRLRISGTVLRCVFHFIYFHLGFAQ